ncbi:hypothetical protein H8356DRAFT_1358383 [Neocallimastix lanati (nom. inval.)]|nr:hypothetical protein H8356DRAFT_1358383 [Neocallimastix sp. JGI-2020a]
MSSSKYIIISEQLNLFKSTILNSYDNDGLSYEEMNNDMFNDDERTSIQLNTAATIKIYETIKITRYTNNTKWKLKVMIPITYYINISLNFSKGKLKSLFLNTKYKPKYFNPTIENSQIYRFFVIINTNHLYNITPPHSSIHHKIPNKLFFKTQIQILSRIKIFGCILYHKNRNSIRPSFLKIIPENSKINNYKQQLEYE